MNNSESKTTQWQRPAHWPDHWCWIDLPEDNGDPRLVEACWALMEVVAKPPAADPEDGREFPVLDFDPDLNDMPRDHTQGTEQDPITQVAVVRLAKAVLAVADRYAGKGTSGT